MSEYNHRRPVTCIYDNPKTFRREFWQNGEIKSSLSAGVILQADWPPEFINPGWTHSWEPGKTVGDSEALN